jgi:hypothetical protein
MQNEPANEARQAAEHLLRETGEALIAQDFSRFGPHFALPQSLATAQGARFLETQADLRGVFEAISGQYRSMGVARLERRVEAALHESADIIHYSHTTRLLRNDGRLIDEPYSALSRAERAAGGPWRVSGSQYGMRDQPGLTSALMSGGTVAAPDAEIAVLGQPAEAVFQHNLDMVTRAFLTGDADLLARHTQLPVFIQDARTTVILATPEDQRAHLQRYNTDFEVHGVTDLVRTVKSVELVGSRRMHGTYRTHVLRGNALLIPSYTSALTLEQGDDLVWRLTSLMHPMGQLTLRRVLLGEET